jgi:hypothetical protein
MASVTDIGETSVIVGPLLAAALFFFFLAQVVPPPRNDIRRMIRRILGSIAES